MYMYAVTTDTRVCMYIHVHVHVCVALKRPLPTKYASRPSYLGKRIILNSLLTAHTWLLYPLLPRNAIIGLITLHLPPLKSGRPELSFLAVGGWPR